MIFYAIYKKQPNHFTIGVNLLQGGPRKEIFFCNVAPGWPASGGPAKFRLTAGLGRPGTGGGGALGLRGPVPGLRWGREKAGEGRRRRPGTVAAAACCTGGVTGLRGRRRTGELMQVQGKVGTRSVWGCSQPEPELAAAACSGAEGGSVWASARGLHVEGKNSGPYRRRASRRTEEG
jgi:hypothetical protein